MPKRRFLLEDRSTTQGSSPTPNREDPPTGPPPTASAAARSDPANAAYVKRTYTIRADQDEAITVALARAQLGQGERLRLKGKKRSEIIEAALDLSGFNQAYIEGHSRLKLNDPAGSGPGGEERADRGSSGKPEHADR